MDAVYLDIVDYQVKMKKEKVIIGNKKVAVLLKVLQLNLQDTVLIRCYKI